MILVDSREPNTPQLHILCLPVSEMANWVLSFDDVPCAVY